MSGHRSGKSGIAGDISWFNKTGLDLLLRSGSAEAEVAQQPREQFPLPDGVLLFKLKTNLELTK